MQFRATAGSFKTHQGIDSGILGSWRARAGSFVALHNGSTREQHDDDGHPPRNRMLHSESTACRRSFAQQKTWIGVIRG